MIDTPTYRDVQKACERIEGKIKKTPVLTSGLLNEMLDCRMYFKCENFQKVGAFKFRGATNAVMSLSEHQLRKGVCTHSSGNHAQALSLAAKQVGAKAYIVMPNNAPEVKIAAVKAYGAEISFCEPTLLARETTLKAIQEKTGATFIHPYDNYNVIAGQATAAMELIQEISTIDTILAPVGGGGLMSGTCISARHLVPNIQIIGTEPKNADDAYRSLLEKKLIPSVNPQTIADGLLTSLSQRTFKIIGNNIDMILTCSEESIIHAMKLIFERMKIIVEPSSAVPLACMLENRTMFKNKTVGIIISGGNIDLSKIPF